MSLAVVGGSSLLKCSFGLSPTPLIVLPNRTVMASHMLMGNISDHKPFANIQPFSQCISMSNPMVASATAAAFGALTPMPCTPVTTEPWISSAVNVLVQGMPAIEQNSKLMCKWSGIITVIQPGNFKVKVP